MRTRADVFSISVVKDLPHTGVIHIGPRTPTIIFSRASYTS